MADRYQRILVGFDASAGSVAALRHAAALADLHRARMTVVGVESEHLTLSETLAATAGLPYAVGFPSLASQLRDAVAGLGAQQLVTTQLRSGDPVKQLLAATEEGACDLIVVGSRHHPALTSVSHRLLSQSSVPVLVVPSDVAPDTASADPAAEPQRMPSSAVDLVAARPRARRWARAGSALI